MTSDGRADARGRILLVDDDGDLCALLAAELSQRGFDVDWKPSASAALEALASVELDVVVADVAMAGMDGLELCERIVANRPDIPVTVMTAHGSLETAVAALRAGAYDFIVKPPDLEVLALTLDRAVQHARLREEVKRLRRATAAPAAFGELLGRSRAMTDVYDLIDRIADSDAAVLITGESGTGKELVARAIHRLGRRNAGPFVAINCASLPEPLLESELFGHVRGAFTDARGARSGLFLQARGGTLFLDEIGDLPLPLQPKLLRAIQERAIRPIGADDEIACDVRIVAATNRDVEAAVEAGTFRGDLFFRINVFHVELPPLRARGTDVLLLAHRFVEQYATAVGKDVTGISPPVADRILSYDWPGNVRELQNCMQRAVALTRYQKIAVDDLPEKLRAYRGHGRVALVDDGSGLLPLWQVERQHILCVLESVRGNRTRAARILGLDRKTLARKLVRSGSRS